MFQKPRRTLRGLEWTHPETCFIENSPLPVSPAVRKQKCIVTFLKLVFRKFAKAKGRKGGREGEREGSHSPKRGAIRDPYFQEPYTWALFGVLNLKKASYKRNSSNKKITPSFQ